MLRRSFLSFFRQGAEAPPLARLSQSLSEPGGAFDTDNLISNEASYLDAMPALERSRLKGGVYIGVGPEQNFSYMAALEPALSFIVDVRRDNLLQHLMLKSIFDIAPDRTAYLATLLGREIPAKPPGPEIESIVKALDRAPHVTLDEGALRARIDAYGFNLSDKDHETIVRFWRIFANYGFRLKFESRGRGRREHHPDLRELVLARDPRERASGFFGSEAAYLRVRRLQQEHRVVPVTGNFSGTGALAAIGAFLKQQKLAVHAVYVSNVEQYLFQKPGAFEQYLANLRALPHAPNALLIRSLFGPFAAQRARRGLYSAQEVEPMDDVLARRAASYRDLVRFGVQ